MGRKCEPIATGLTALVLRTLPLPERLLLVIDGHRPKGGPPTRRYGPKVEWADVHAGPTPGPADQPYLYGHIWVTISRPSCGVAVARISESQRRASTSASRRRWESSRFCPAPTSMQ